MAMSGCCKFCGHGQSNISNWSAPCSAETGSSRVSLKLWRSGLRRVAGSALFTSRCYGMLSFCTPRQVPRFGLTRQSAGNLQCHGECLRQSPSPCGHSGAGGRLAQVGIRPPAARKRLRFWQSKGRAPRGGRWDHVAGDPGRAPGDFGCQVLREFASDPQRDLCRDA